MSYFGHGQGVILRWVSGVGLPPFPTSGLTFLSMFTSRALGVLAVWRGMMWPPEGHEVSRWPDSLHPAPCLPSSTLSLPPLLPSSASVASPCRKPPLRLRRMTPRSITPCRASKPISQVTLIPPTLCSEHPSECRLQASGPGPLLHPHHGAHSLGATLTWPPPPQNTLSSGLLGPHTHLAAPTPHSLGSWFLLWSAQHQRGKRDISVGRGTPAWGEGERQPG